MCFGVDKDGGGVVLEMPHAGHKTHFFFFFFILSNLIQCSHLECGAIEMPWLYGPDILKFFFHGYKVIWRLFKIKSPNYLMLLIQATANYKVSKSIIKQNNKPH